MKRAPAILFLFLAFAARAHIGSPNVFFDGQAGPYAAHVIVRPPNVVPGLAEISVRVEGEGVQRITVLPVFWSAGRGGSPPPDEAKAVRGETNLYTATLWLMKPGAYSVNVDVEGAKGGGTLIVPVNSSATNTRPMSRAYALMLAALGVALFAGAVRIAGAAFGESLSAAGEIPAAATRRSGYIAMAVTAPVLAMLLWGGKKWWDFEEHNYRNERLYRPAATSALVTERTNQNVVELAVEPKGGPGEWAPLMPDHGKLMHLFLVREPDFNVFAHLHPTRPNPLRFEAALPPLPAGRYDVYADITHENGFAETLTTAVEVPAPSPAWARFWAGNSPDMICGADIARLAREGFALPPDPDDSWHVDRADPSIGTQGAAGTVIANVSDGRKMVWQKPGALVENREVSLRFQLLGTNDQPALIELYMGMPGHAIIRRDDGTVFAHIHPMGTFSMAAQEYFAKGAGEKTASTPDAGEVLAPKTDGMETHAHTNNAVGVAREVSFPYAFPAAGAYHIWVQLKSGGRIYTGAFQAEVQK